MSGFSVFDQAALVVVQHRLTTLQPLAQRRRALGLTLDRLAELAGVCTATIKRVQAGFEVKHSTLARIHAALAVAEGARA